MCLFCTKEDLGVCKNIISQPFLLLKKLVVLFVKETENIINCVIRANMKKTKQRKQELKKGGGRKTSPSQLFLWLATDKLPNKFSCTSRSRCKHISVFMGHTLASPHHSKGWRWRCQTPWPHHAMAEQHCLRTSLGQKRSFEWCLQLVPANLALLYIVKWMEGAQCASAVTGSLELGRGKSMKYIQHWCPYFQLLIILMNTLCLVQNHVSTKMPFCLPGIACCRLFLNEKGSCSYSHLRGKTRNMGKHSFFMIIVF